MRGSIQGSLWGLILGGAGLGFVSLVAEQPVRAPAPPVPELVAPQIAQAGPTVSDIAVGTPEPARDFGAAPAPIETTDVQEAAPTPDTTSPEAPATAPVETVLDVPADVPAPAPASEADTPVAMAADVAAPQQPTAADVVDIQTEPADPLAQPQDAPPAAAVEAPQAPIEVEEATAPEVVAEVNPGPMSEPAAPEESETVTSTAEVVVVEEPEIATPEPSVAETTLAQDVAPQTSALPVVIEPETPVADNMPAPADDQPVIAAVPVDDRPDATTEAPAILSPTQEASALPQANANVRVNRPGAAPTETAGQDAVVIEANPIPDDAPALLRYAAEFENADDLPVIAILLVDTGSMEDAATALSGLGFAPTVAVNALVADATSRMTSYRAAGAEVAIEVSLPPGARPTDVEVAFEAAFGILPESTMLFSDGTGILQDDRSVMAQVMQVLAADGRGFVTVQRGLGNAVRTAEQANVPATTVLRDLDGEGEDAASITRALDQAAFRARQTGGAVLMGRMTPATVDALREWAAGLDTSQVAIGPVSAVLLNAAD